MQIQKISNDKVKVIINSSDLLEKNIAVDSFLSNSEESQAFFFEILDFIEEKYSFDIESNKAIVETVSLDNNIFVLTITKLSSDSTANSCLPVFVFSSLENIFELYLSLKKNFSFNLDKLYIYKFGNFYYVFTDENNNVLENFLFEYSCKCRYSCVLKDILFEYGKRVNLK